VLESRIGDKLKQTKITGGTHGRLLFVEFPCGLEFKNKGSSGSSVGGLGPFRALAACK
jgi:hypothetical protein